MARTIRRPSYTWVGYSNGRYLAIIEPRYRIMARSSTVICLVDENSQYVDCFAVPAVASVFSGVVNDLCEGYGLDIRFDVESREPMNAAYRAGYGQWMPTKSLHPLVEKAVKIGWDWFKRYALDQGEYPNVSYREKVKLPPGSVRRYNGITFEGYTQRALKVHSFGTIAKLVDDGIKLGRDAWGWEPVDLRVMIHNDSRAMGLAYNPGKGVHRISLNSRLLNEYDTMSIFRTVIHELCHHYRDERFPINKLDAHDEIFCHELGKIDPVVVQNPKECVMFTDEVWQDSLVVKAKVEKQAAKKKADNYDHREGYLQMRVLKSGELRMDWLPNQKGGFANKAMPVTVSNLQLLLQSTDPSKVRVTGKGRGLKYLMHITGKTEVTLLQAAKSMARRHSNLKKIEEFLP